MRHKWLLAGAAVLLIAGAAGGYYWYAHRHPASAQPSKPVQPAKAPPPETEVSLLGKIQAKNVVNVAAPIDGAVDSYLADVGEEVFEGELLARIKNEALDSAHQTAQVDAARAQTHVTDLEGQVITARLEASRARSEAVRAKADLERAEKDYKRQAVLVEAGATPRLVYEKSQREYENYKTNYDGLESLAKNAEDRVTALAKEIDAAKTDAAAKVQELDNSETQVSSEEVRSPVNGVLVARRGQAGEQVDPQMKDLLQIAVDLSALEVAVDADPRVLAQVKQGQEALILVAEAPSGIPGTVREIKAGRVFVDFTSPSPAVKPGLTAQVKIKLG